ncbi:hypothetical protein J7M02_03930 [Candidatus Aerophobetes bacterium]|nr:hypothetical protein [Candidatus Aerophobetes bacterium]
MGNLQKIKSCGRISLKIILTVLIVMLVTGIGYISSKLWSEERGESQIIDISSWRTYKNKEYGYEIKYPKEFICDDSNKKHVKIGTKVMPYIRVDVYSNFNNLDLKKFISQLLKKQFGELLDLSNVTWEQINVNGVGGLRANFENVADGYTGKLSWDYIQRNDRVYRIALLQSFKGYSYSALHTLLLSTFKFTE